MNPRAKLVLLLAIPGLAGCAAQKYRAAPLTPTTVAARLEARSLQDPGLRKFMQNALGHPLQAWPLGSWDLSSLTLAAFYFNPRLAVARAGLGVAQAAEITAGERPNPSVSLTPGIPSPYLFGLSFLFPIETAGKRGYRIEQARAGTALARLDVGATAWNVRAGVRQALVDQVVAARSMRLLLDEEQLSARQVSLLQARLRVGEIARRPVDDARIQLGSIRVALASAQGRADETRARLAAAIGIPVSGLQGANFHWAGFERLPDTTALSSERMQRDAVLNRLDVRRARVAYAAAESSLQLEIARQYPDIEIGPGYQFEESNNFFTVGLSATLPVLNRNQGPIAEAEARRKQLAADFLATQSQVIAETELALAGYRAARHELEAVRDSLDRLQQMQVARVLRSVQAGESGGLALNQVRLQSITLAETVLTSLGRAQTALGALEKAVQRPLVPGELNPPNLLAKTPARATARH